MCVPPCDAGVKPMPPKPASRPECMSTSPIRANETRTCQTATACSISAPRVAESMAEDVRDQIRKLLVTGDNRLKQGVAAAKVRESYEQALELAREAGLEGTVRPL